MVVLIQYTQQISKMVYGCTRPSRELYFLIWWIYFVMRLLLFMWNLVFLFEKNFASLCNFIQVFVKCLLINVVDCLQKQDMVPKLRTQIGMGQAANQLDVIAKHAEGARVLQPKKMGNTKPDVSSSHEPQQNAEKTYEHDFNKYRCKH